MVRELERLEHAGAALARAGARSVPRLRSASSHRPPSVRRTGRANQAHQRQSQRQEGWRRSTARPRRAAKPAPRCSSRLLKRQAAARRRSPTRLASRRASPRQPSQGWSSNAVCAASPRADTPWLSRPPAPQRRCGDTCASGCTSTASTTSTPRTRPSFSTPGPHGARAEPPSATGYRLQAQTSASAVAAETFATDELRARHPVRHRRSHPRPMQARAGRRVGRLELVRSGSRSGVTEGVARSGALLIRCTSNGRRGRRAGGGLGRVSAAGRPLTRPSLGRLAALRESRDVDVLIEAAG